MEKENKKEAEWLNVKALKVNSSDSIYFRLGVETGRKEIINQIIDILGLRDIFATKDEIK